jgi:hypothetical protein
MTKTLTPIPQPSEIVAFLIRAMSHVDDQHEEALKKELQRLRKGKPVSPEAANDLLKQHLATFYEANGNDVWDAMDVFLEDLKEYSSLCLHLDCSALPARAVRSVFDRVAFGHFLNIFQAILPVTGVAPAEILGSPDQATKLLWQSRLKDLGSARLASEIESCPGLRKGQENWESSIKRWSKGDHHPQIHTILTLMKNWDREFARALLAARIYQKYCEFSLVDPSNHVAGYELPFDYNAIQSAVLVVAKSPRYRKTCGLSPSDEQTINEIAKLTDPKRSKTHKDSSRADALFKTLTGSLQDQPRLAGILFYRGRYHAQMGRYDDALDAFDTAANWFQFRSAIQMKCCLHYILNLASKLGKKRTLAKWQGWCEGLELGLDIPDADLSVSRDFPELFPEAQSANNADPLSNYLLIMPEWEERKPDLRNPNRVIKGYGPTPTPQLSLFANLGQVEKVRQLLRVGADPDALDRNNGSALLNALQGEDDACVQALLAVTSTETINVKTKGGKSPLLLAISLGNSDYVQSLLEKGADVEITSLNQQTALYESVSHFVDPMKMARSALQPGRGLDMPAFLRKTSSPFRDEQAHSMSHYSPEESEILPGLAKHCIKGDSPAMRNVVKLLLDGGANVNALAGSLKLTPFLYAAEIGNSWLLQTLVDHGADVRSRDDQGGTAFSRLHYFGHSHLVSEFLRWLPPEDRIWLRENGFR